MLRLLSLTVCRPPRQYQPMQECLGWVLLQQGKLKAAEQVCVVCRESVAQQLIGCLSLLVVHQPSESEQGTKDSSLGSTLRPMCLLCRLLPGHPHAHGVPVSTLTAT
jgi:hypothetical protein